jgi:glycosyltransferase involved in cell wall biosynthesis
MNKRYLLVSHIPFLRTPEGCMVDQLWANDLKELTKHVGPIRLAAPEIISQENHDRWGPQIVPVDPAAPITFIGFPAMQHSWEVWTWWKIRRILREEVERADIVHSSNLFNPYLGLLYAHFLAAKLGKKTVFVVAEDYHDSLIWEWVRPANNVLKKLLRRLVVSHMDGLMQTAVSRASLTFLFTPAALQRFRLYASNGYAVRDTTHSEADVISDDKMKAKSQAITSNTPLKLITACRHKPLKGIEFIVRAIALLKQKNIYVEADIYGHGPLTPELADLARHLNVKDRIRFPGTLAANSEIFQAFANHHLSLMPHRTNEFARALYDSLAGGTPVIAFDTPASKGSVREGIDGMLVPLDNAVALAVAIEHLHQHRFLLATMSENCRTRALFETRALWHQFRADLIEELFEKDKA